jgi:hypothetical protein
MKDQTYSSISSQIHQNLKNPIPNRDAFMRLMAQSHELVTSHPTARSKLLHDKYVELGRIKYGMVHIREHVASGNLDRLKNEFEIDPSNMAVVMRLAIEYSVIGQPKKARQLLERISESGYPERALAVKMIQALSAGDTLK